MAIGDLQRAVGRNLRAHRKAKGLSQEAFAEFIGIHRTYVGAVERGERNLTLATVERYAERIGVPPLDLLTEQSPPDATPKPPRTSRTRRKPEIIEHMR